MGAPSWPMINQDSVSLHCKIHSMVSEYGKTRGCAATFCNFDLLLFMYTWNSCQVFGIYILENSSQLVYQESLGVFLILQAVSLKIGGSTSGSASHDPLLEAPQEYLVVGGAILSSKEEMYMHSRSKSPSMSKTQSHNERDNMKNELKLQNKKGASR